MQNFVHNLGNFFRNSWQGLKLLPNLRKAQIPHILENFTGRDVLLTIIFAALFLTSGGFLIFGSTESIDNGLPDYGGEHVEGLVGQPRFINPVLAPASSVDTDLARLVYGQLLKFDKDLKLVPDLALNLPEVSADKKIFTLRLKPDLVWHDGKPLRADDVIFTIGVIQNQDYESPLRSNWSRVRVEKIDDLTLRFTLREVSASFITNFTVGILPKHIWENTSPLNFRLSDNNLRPIGSGPYALREIKKTSDGTIKSISLRSNENYHEGQPYIDRLNLKFYNDYDALVAAYQAKEINGLGYVPFDKKAFIQPSSRYNQFKINLPQYQAAFFNLQKSPIVQDKAVRQALWLSTEREQIINEVYLGYAKQAFGPILEGNLGYNPEIKERTHADIDEAVGILEKSGWLMDPEANVRMKNKKPLEFTLATNNFVLNIKTAQILQSQWSRVGANVHLVIVSSSDLEQQYIRPRNFDVLLFSENTGADPDPFAFWHSSQSRDPGLNLSGFTNQEVDRLLTAARQTDDVNIRTQNYMQFQNIITNEIPAIFLDSAVYVYNVPKKVKGIELETIIHPSERFTDIRNWYIETK
ncbi:MAG TPA: peptide ABC transporter substrate-binding protein [Verrucomicrobiae bacterium]|nr:peptide ABC transporter substrate-binding protein [Verrucomicrobiae bacterium]